MNDRKTQFQADYYMNTYQVIAGALLAAIPDEDTSISERAQKQLELANEYAVKTMDALANIIELIDNPDAEDDDLF